jgi:hypothetical protein
MDEIFAISPHYTTDDFPDIGNDTVDNQILVYADRVRGWQPEQAQALRDVPGTGPHSGLAVLAVIVSYFESTEMYRDGYVRKPQDRMSTRYLIAGLRRILVNHIVSEREIDFEKVAEIMSEDVRNGMYHESITGPRIILNRLEPPIVIQVIEDEAGSIALLRIDPYRLVDVLGADFNAYEHELKDQQNQQLRNNFRAHFRGRKGL